MPGINMHFGNNDNNHDHNHDQNTQHHNNPNLDDCPYDGDCHELGEIDIDIVPESTNPLDFEGGFNIKEFLRLLHNKVDKVKGKNLSTNDFTDYFKNLLSNTAQALSNYVLKTTKINGKALTGDIILTLADLGGQPVTDSYREIFIMEEGQEQLTLLHIPSNDKKVVVCINGLIGYPGNDFDYNLVGKVITFNYSFSVGEKIMVTYDVIEN